MTRWGDPPLVPRGKMDRRTGWLSVKEIDGLPGEWSYNIACQRSSRFHYQNMFYVYYEPLWITDQFVECIWLAYNLSTAFGQPLSGVEVAFLAYESIYDAPLGRIPMPGSDEDCVGSHNVRLIGGDHIAQTFDFVNSWGPEWGNNGHGQLTLEYLEEYGWDAWLGWDVHHGPPSATIPEIFQLLHDSDPVPSYELKRLWTKRVPQGRDTAVGPQGEYDIRWFKHASLTGRCDVNVVEARLGSVLVGWCMGLERQRRESGEHVLQLFELFVWPPYRGKGVARSLIDALLRFASFWNASTLEVVVHNVDHPDLDLPRLESKGWIWIGEGTCWPPMLGVLKRSLTA